MKKFLKKRNNKTVQVCINCIYDSDIKGVSFNNQGICNYCLEIEKIKKEYSTGTIQGQKSLDEIIEKVKKRGVNKKYDCLVGVSGGVDSSFLLDFVVKKGLRPLAVHYDNTWNSSIATENISKILKKLKVDLYTIVLDNKEIDDIHKSFFISGLPDIDAPTDLGLTETLYRAAQKFNIKYMFDGHSFMTEGFSSIGDNYFDGKYIKEVHKRFGNIEMKTYPLMTLTAFLKWTLLLRIKRIQPFWYIKYSKEEAKKYLKKKFGWQYYGGHHLENKMSRFAHNIYLKKFSIDYRNLTLGADVREKRTSRNKAWNNYCKERPYDSEIEQYFKKRMQMSDNEFKSIMNGKKRSWNEFPNYKKTFEFLSPIFFLLLKLQIIRRSFYFKYCKKHKI